MSYSPRWRPSRRASPIGVPAGELAAEGQRRHDRPDELGQSRCRAAGPRRAPGVPTSHRSPTPVPAVLAAHSDCRPGRRSARARSRVDPRMARTAASSIGPVEPVGRGTRRPRGRVVAVERPDRLARSSQPSGSTTRTTSRHELARHGELPFPRRRDDPTGRPRACRNRAARGLWSTSSSRLRRLGAQHVPRSPAASGAGTVAGPGEDRAATGWVVRTPTS